VINESMKSRKSLERKSFEDLKKEVINVGMCVGCGICSGVCPDQVIDLSGQEQEPALIGKCRKRCGPGACYHSCPGRYIPMPQMEKMLFGRSRDLDDPYEYAMGITDGCFAAHATDNAIRNGGASGGTATALLGYLMDQGISDALLIGGFKQDKPWITEPKIITETKELFHWQGSVYNRVPIGRLLHTLVKSGFKRIGVIGLPCLIHGIRKIQLHHFPEEIAEKIHFVIGLICGTSCTVEGVLHLLREWMEVDVENIEKLNFRGGEWPGSLVIKTRDGKEFAIPKDRYMDRFLVTMFRVDRCTKCWDFIGDLADLCLGDLWSAPSSLGQKKGGWNSLIVKTPLGKSLVDRAARGKYIAWEPIPLEHIFAMPGWELKKHSNSYAMAVRGKHGDPVPDYVYKTDSYLRPLPSKQPVWTPERGGTGRATKD
jgi:coenzyme F420 hydrogenase subunit beta